MICLIKKIKKFKSNSKNFKTYKLNNTVIETKTQKAKSHWGINLPILITIKK